MLLALHYSDTSPSTEVSIGRIPTVEDRTNEWAAVCEHLVQMMMNSDEAAKGRIDVVIFLIGMQVRDLDHEGFELMLNKFASERITIRSFMASSVQKDVRADFVFLILDNRMTNIDTLIEQNFRIIFEDQTTKFFVIIRNSQLLQPTWKSLMKTRYFNAYFIILRKNREFQMSRTVIEGIGNKAVLDLKETRVTKYQKIREILQNEQISGYNVVFYNMYPVTYVKNGNIVGPAGNLVRELTKQIGIPYRIINDPTSSPSLYEAYRYMEFRADINLFPTFSFLSTKFSTTWINEIDGMCLLVPRNILVSSYESFELPLDKASLILAFISTVSVIICWKIVSIVTKSQRSILSILAAVYDLTLNIGASGLEEATIHENFLIYSYIFSSFILVSFYQSIFLSLMLMETTLRSAESIQELIDTKTKFYTYADVRTAVQESIPIIPDDLIINKINLLSPLSLQVPMKFDKNLVYFVFCQYADNFFASSRNLLNNGQIFDKMVLGVNFQRYTTRKGFFFNDEFVKLLVKLQESGIYKYWYKQSYDESLGNEKAVDQNEVSAFDIISFSGMGIPLVVLLIGCIVSLIVFLVEYITYRWKESCLNRIKMMRNQEQGLRVKQKVKLDKWMQKYLYKKKVGGAIKARNDKLSPVIDQMLAMDMKNEIIRGRESLNGAFFAFKKFKKPTKQRIRHRIIQVKPYCAETSV